MTAFLSVLRSVMGSRKKSSDEESSYISPSIVLTSSPESSSEKAVLRGCRVDAASDNSASDWLRGMG